MQETMWQAGALFKKQQISITDSSSQVVNDLNAVTNKVAVSTLSASQVGTARVSSDLTRFLVRL